LASDTGDAVNFVLQTDDGNHGEIELVELYDEGLTVTSSPEAVWNSIVGQRAPAKLTHTITVQVASTLFQSVVAAGGAPLIEIIVIFAGGAALSFLPPGADRPDLLSQQARVEVALADYVLGRSTAGEYRYRVQWIFRDGTSIADSSDRVASTNILMILQR